MDDLTQGRVDMREGQRGEGPETPGETGHQFCVRLVRRPRQRHGVGLPHQVWGLRRHGKHLKVDACSAHQRETVVQIGLGRLCADPALGAGIGLPQSFEAVQVPRGPQVSVHIDTQMGHPSMKRPPRGAGQSAARAVTAQGGAARDAASQVPCANVRHGCHGAQALGNRIWLSTPLEQRWARWTGLEA